MKTAHQIPKAIPRFIVDFKFKITILPDEAPIYSCEPYCPNNIG